MKKNYSMRDYLAKDRTHLANERTSLAYWRTSLAFLILGSFLAKFLSSVYINVLALISIIFGIVLFVYGAARYFKHKQVIENR